MKRDLLIFWNQVKLAYYWGRMRKRLDREELFADVLVPVDPVFRHWRDEYLKAKQFLIDEGEYVPARKPE